MADEDDLYDILSYLKDVQAQCYKIGTALRLKQDILDTIKQESADHTEALTKIITNWLRKNYNFEKFGEPTWNSLVEAVESPIGGGNTALAMKIAEDHGLPWGHQGTKTIEYPVSSFFECMHVQHR